MYTVQQRKPNYDKQGFTCTGMILLACYPNFNISIIAQDNSILGDLLIHCCGTSLLWNSEWHYTLSYVLCYSYLHLALSLSLLLIFPMKQFVIVTPVLFLLPNLFYNLVRELTITVYYTSKITQWNFYVYSLNGLWKRKDHGCLKVVRNNFFTVSFIICLFLSDAYQIQKSVTISNETTVILNGDHHNHSLAPPAEPSVTTTIAVIHEEEDEEEEEKTSTGSRQQRSHSDTTVVWMWILLCT